MSHPILPCGFNADDNNGDEVDGAGTNWPIWPTYFDSFESKRVLILTDEMLEAFEGCPDVIPEGEYVPAVFPAIDPVVPISRDSWITAFMVPPPANAIILQAASTVVQIVPDKWLDTIIIPATRNDLTVPHGVQEQTVIPQDSWIVPPASVDTEARQNA